MNSRDDEKNSGVDGQAAGKKDAGSSYRPCEAIIETRVGHEFTQDITVGGVDMIGDEPVVFGGDDLGPNPYEYLACALGACTNMTVQMYARRKGFKLQRVKTTVRHNKVYAKDLEHVEDKTGKLDVLDCEIELYGDLDEETRERIMSIARRCPVHKTLQSEIHIQTREAER
jgi:putative redox protein